MSLIARRNFKHLPKKELAVMVGIEERLRTPGGRMPSVPDSKRRLSVLRTALPKTEAREEKLKPFSGLFLFAAIIFYFCLKYLGPRYLSETTQLAILMIFTLPFVIFFGLQFLDTKMAYGSSQEINLEIDLLEAFLKEKGVQV